MTVGEKIAPKPKASAPKPEGTALTIDAVPVDAHCTGSRRAAADLDLLARIVAIIGPSAHAVIGGNRAPPRIASAYSDTTSPLMPSRAQIAVTSSSTSGTRRVSVAAIRPSTSSRDMSMP